MPQSLTHSQGKHIAAIFRAAIFFFVAFAVAGIGGRQQARIMPGKTLRDSILDALRSAKGSPLSKSQLTRGLKLPGTRVTELRNTLAALVKEGVITEGKKACYQIADVGRRDEIRAHKPGAELILRGSGLGKA